MQTNLPSWLGTVRGDRFLCVVETLLHVRTTQQFQRWSQQELQRALPHERLACGVGPMTERGLLTPRVLTTNFPDGYIESLRERGGGVETPVMAQWRRQHRPQLFEAERPHFACHAGWLSGFRREGMRNCVSHGLQDLSGAGSSYFSFCSVPGRLDPHHGFLAELLVPHLHVALGRALAANGQRHVVVPDLHSLTDREYDIVTWLKQGKSNWEIGRILGLSELTVKTHVQRIFRKLRVNNRTQAVAKILAREILGVD